MVSQLSLMQSSGAPQIQIPDPLPVAILQTQPSIANLVESARHVLYEAKSIVSHSEAGSGDTASTTSSLHNLSLFEQGEAVVLPQSQSPATETYFRRIIDWNATASLADISHSEAASTIDQTQMTPTQSSFGASTIRDEQEHVIDEETSDNEDELDYETLKAYLDSAFASYESGDWATAELYLRRSIEASRLLPPDKVRKKGIDMEEAKFRVAICNIHQKSLAHADYEFLKLGMIRAAPREQKSTILRRVLSVYLCAEICFENGRLDDALKYSAKAFSLKQKLQGQTVGLEAMLFSLLSAITETQGDNIKAQAYEAKARKLAARDFALDHEPEVRLARLSRYIATHAEHLQRIDLSAHAQYVRKDKHMVILYYNTAWAKANRPKYEALKCQLAE